MDINRRIAYETLIDIEKNQTYSNLALNDHLKGSAGDDGMRAAFVREIVYGVLKNKRLLDFCINAYVTKKEAKIRVRELTVLRMGAYQLLFMNSVPAYAAVSETVALAKKAVGGQFRFVNGVLRAMERGLEAINLDSWKGNGHCDEFESRAEYFAVKYSAAKWIVDLWIEQLGEVKAEKLLEASNSTPRLSLRVNMLKIQRSELMELLRSNEVDVSVSESERSERAVLVKGSGVAGSKAYRDGLFSVQDEASIISSDVLGAAPEDVLIDVCAAPGGKTFAAAEMMCNRGKIIAMDIYPHKLKLIEEQAVRLGVSIVETRCHDGQELCEELLDSADKVIADVPCTGLGVLRRKPEIKDREDVDLVELVDRQRNILNNASKYVKIGGVLLYSTCTINYDENRGQMERFLGTHPNFSKAFEKELLPDGGTDGFYICKLVRDR